MNVAIIAIAEDGLEVDVVLGANVRRTHKVAGGDSVELAVAGGQTLVVRQSAEVAPTAEATAESEGDLPTGVDVTENVEAPAVVEGDDSPRVSEDAAGNTLVPGVDVFPEDGQLVPPLDGVDADGQTNPPAAEVDEDQADLFADGNPFETGGEVEKSE